MKRLRGLFRLLSVLGGLGLGVWLSQPVEVTVGRGDTWATIAARHRVAVRELRAVNPGLSALKPGMAVRLPIPRWRFFLRAWGVEQEMAGILVTPTPPPKVRRPALTAELPRPTVGRELLLAAVEVINREREAMGRPPLAWDDGLAALAQARAEDMVARRYFSHNDPSTGRPALEGRLSKYTDGVVSRLGPASHISLSPFRLMRWLLSVKSSPPHWAVLTDPEMNRIGWGIACGRWPEGEVCILVGVVDR